jgi:hypothetical protein
MKSLGFITKSNIYCSVETKRRRQMLGRAWIVLYSLAFLMNSRGGFSIHFQNPIQFAQH